MYPALVAHRGLRDRPAEHRRPGRQPAAAAQHDQLAVRRLAADATEAEIEVEIEVDRAFGRHRAFHSVLVGADRGHGAPVAAPSNAVIRAPR